MLFILSAFTIVMEPKHLNGDFPISNEAKRRSIYIYIQVYIYVYIIYICIYIYIYLCLNDLVRTLSYFSSGVNYISCGSNIAVFCAFKNVNQATKTTY